MPTHSLKAFGCVLALVASHAALAAPSVPLTVGCDGFSSSATAFDDCVGLSLGNTSAADADAAFGDDPLYTGKYKDNLTGIGSSNAVFDLVDIGNDSFTIEFLQNVGDGSSSALIALKFGDRGDTRVGYFRYDLADFDAGEKLSFSWSSFPGDSIAHAELYTNQVFSASASALQINAVPEPATPALMLAALAAALFAPIRRRSR